MKGTIEEAKIIIDRIASADDGIGGDLVSELRVRMSPEGRAQWLVYAAREWMNAPDECIWSEDRFACFHPACTDDETWEKHQGGPKANAFKYCPFCGKTVVEMPYKEVEG